MLSLTVFQLIVAEQMPPLEDIPIIGLSRANLKVLALRSFGFDLTRANTRGQIK